MKKINLVLLNDFTNFEINALNHPIQYLYFNFVELGYSVKISVNNLCNKCINIIFGAHTNHQINLKRSNIVIFNSEQLHPDSRTSSDFYKEILNEHIVFDYCPLNLEYVNHSNKFQINFIYCRQLSDKVKAREKECDLIFYGLPNDRRQKLIKNIRSKGIIVHNLFGVYGSELDDYLSKSRAVLNLHYYENFHFFQSIRAFYALSNSIPVISENFIHDSAHPVYEHVIFTPKNISFEDYVEDYFSNNSIFETFEEKLELFKTSECMNLKNAIESI